MIPIRNMTHADTFTKNEPFPLFGRMIVRYDDASPADKHDIYLYKIL